MVTSPQPLRVTLWRSDHKLTLVQGPSVTCYSHLSCCCVQQHFRRQLLSVAAKAGIEFAELTPARPHSPERLMDAQRTLRRQISCVGIGSAFRQQGQPFAQTGPGQLRHPFPPHRPRRPRRAGDGASPGRHPARHGPGAQRGFGRDGRAPAGGAGQHEHRQRADRAELAGSADHGRQRRAVHLPHSGSGREAAAGAAQVPEDRPADRHLAGRQAHLALSRPITSRSPTASATTTRCCGISRGPCASPKSRSSKRSRRRAPSRS